ncbi:MAG: hypothetical protein ACKVS9_02665 [Phycisphaerae bacterium]
MRPWIGGFLLGIARWIGRLAWPLLLLWFVSHRYQLEFSAQIPARTATGISMAATRGGVGVSYKQTSFSTSSLTALSAIILFRPVDFGAWFPHVRRVVYCEQWLRAVGWSGPASSKNVSVARVVVPLLLIAGIAFAVRLVSTLRAPAHRRFPVRAIIAWSAGVCGLASLIACIWAFNRATHAGADPVLASRTIITSPIGTQVVEFNDFRIGISSHIRRTPQDLWISPLISAKFEGTIYLTPPDIADSARFLEFAFYHARAATLNSQFQMPTWLALAVLAAASIAVWFLFRPRRRKGHCRQCHYNLTGNTSGVCPECGTPVDPRAATRSDPSSPKPPSRIGVLTWRAVATTAIALLVADVAYAAAYAATPLAASGGIRALNSAVVAGSSFAVVWLTIAATLVCSLTRRIEPPGYLRYRLIVAANLVALIAASWPVG